jgi:rubrerythrin
MDKELRKIIRQDAPKKEYRPIDRTKPTIEKLNNGIAKCLVCDNLFDYENSSICPYCNYTREQRINYLQNKRKE